MENNRLKLTAVVCVYNEERNIERCIQSLLDQGDAIDEIIVVDNKSTDKSMEIVKKMKAPHMRVINETQQGLIYARGRGFGEAKGDIVARIDADAYVVAGWADALNEYFAKADEKVWAVRGRVYYHDLPPLVSKKFFLTALDLFDKCFNMAFNRTSKGYALYGCNMAIRKTAWIRIEPHTTPRVDVMEDFDITYTIHNMGGYTDIVWGMVAYASARRLASRPDKFWKYSIMWPRTHYINGHRFRSIFIFIAMLGGNVLQFFAWIGLSFYDPTENKIDMNVRKRNFEERIIP